MQEMMGTQAITSVTKVKLKILISVGCNQAANQNKCTTIACNISTLLSALLWGYVHRRATIQNYCSRRCALSVTFCQSFC